VEAAYQRGDLDYARQWAGVARTRPDIRLPANHQDRAAIEAVALGRDPGVREMTAHLNNRAELWSADGRPADDPLTGLSLVTASRCIRGEEGDHLTASARDLVWHSESVLADLAERLLQSQRQCAECGALHLVKYQTVCGTCHRVYCQSCLFRSKIGGCRCGGDLATPHVSDIRHTHMDFQPVDLFPAGEGQESGNLIILDRGSRAEHRLARVIDLWVSAGKRENWLISGKAFFLVYCWWLEFYHSNKNGNVSQYASFFQSLPDASDYIDASLSFIGDDAGWNELLEHRMPCHLCKQISRLENTAICIDCIRYYCWECSGDSKENHRLVG
jgi:hypothetical protein